MTDKNATLTKTQYIEVRRLIKDETEILSVLLEKLSQGLLELKIESTKRLSRIDGSIKLLNFKSGIWGAFGASIPVSIGVIFTMIYSK